MALPSVTAGGLNAVPPELLGKAAGTLNTMQQFGAVFGVAVVTAVFNAHGSLASPAAVTSGYRAALAVSAGASVVGALAAWASGVPGPVASAGPWRSNRRRRSSGGWPDRRDVKAVPVETGPGPRCQQRTSPGVGSVPSRWIG